MQRKYHQHKIRDPPSLSIRGGQTVPSFTRQVQSREFFGTVTHCPATQYHCYKVKKIFILIIVINIFENLIHYFSFMLKRMMKCLLNCSFTPHNDLLVPYPKCHMEAKKFNLIATWRIILSKET